MALAIALLAILVEAFWIWVFFDLFYPGCWMCNDNDAWITIFFFPPWLIIEVPLAIAGFLGGVYVLVRINRAVRG